MKKRNYVAHAYEKVGGVNRAIGIMDVPTRPPTTIASVDEF
jgi:hypothetical protein